jgi:hypothetical protein
MDNLSPLGDLFKNLSNSRANFFLRSFCKPLWQVPFWALFKFTVALETSLIIFACTAAALSAPKSFLPSFDSSVPPPVSPSPGTASLPAAASDRVHQV